MIRTRPSRVVPCRFHDSCCIMHTGRSMHTSILRSVHTVSIMHTGHVSTSISSSVFNTILLLIIQPQTRCEQQMSRKDDLEVFHTRKAFLDKCFYTTFPSTRESYSRTAEQHLTKHLARNEAWTRIGKPYYKYDAKTRAVYRKSHQGHRITVCIPYVMAFQIAVCWSLAQILLCVTE